MASQVEIANRALDLLGATPIVALTEDSENARAINRCYNIILRSMLRKHVWNCAKKRVVLAPLAATPAFDYTYQFQLPSDCLRPIFPSDVTDWSVEKGGVLLTNDGNVLNLLYIAMLDDPNDMDDCFVEVFAAELAVKNCEKLTQSVSKRKEAKEELKDAWSDARKANAFESVAQLEDYSSWVDARITGPGVNNTIVQRIN